MGGYRVLSAALLTSVWCNMAARADDEIQVYTGEITEVGKWTAQHHFNYAIQGRTEPDFPGGLVPNHTLNATPEFAYGVTPWFEAGFYVPWAIDKDGYHSNAAKLRTLFVTPDAGKREFFYGVNFEYDYLMPKFADTRYGMEIRPIIGWRKGDYEFIVNPIIDLSFGRNGEAVFAPNARFARNFGEDFALAVEYYTDLGPFTHFLPLKEQSHAIYGVTDFKIGRFDIEAGIGYGLTKPGSDRLVTKLMVTTNLFDSKEDELKSNASSKAALPTKAPKKAPAAEVPYNYSGCFAGGYGGGTWAADIHTFDPSSIGGAIPAGTFYNTPFANRGNGGAYRIPFKESPTAGGTLGCNWQAAQSAWVWGAEGESGFMRLRGRAIDPYSSRLQQRHHRYHHDRQLVWLGRRPLRLRLRARVVLWEGRRRFHGPQINCRRRLQRGSLRNRLAERHRTTAPCARSRSPAAVSNGPGPATGRSSSNIFFSD